MEDLFIMIKNSDFATFPAIFLYIFFESSRRRTWYLTSESNFLSMD